MNHESVIVTKVNRSGSGRGGMALGDFWHFQSDLAAREGV